MEILVMRKANVGRHGHQTAELLRRDSQWILRVHVATQYQFDLLDSARQKGIPDWTDDEQEAWIERFKTRACNAWSYRFALHRVTVTSSLNVDVPLLVDVELVIKDVDVEHMLRGREHVFRVIVTRGHEGGAVTFQAPAQIEVGEQHVDIRPSRTRNVPTRPVVSQRATDHEIGHALGLHHPNCADDSDESPRCYGDPDTPEESDLMGAGRVVSKRDYEVFAEILTELVPAQWAIVEDVFGATGTRPAHWTRIPTVARGRLPGPTGSIRPVKKLPRPKTAIQIRRCEVKDWK